LGRKWQFSAYLWSNRQFPPQIQGLCDKELSVL